MPENTIIAIGAMASNHMRAPRKRGLARPANMLPAKAAEHVFASRPADYFRDGPIQVITP